LVLRGLANKRDLNYGDISGRLVGLTPGFAGFDIANICTEAAIVVARRNAETVTIENFEKVTDRIIGGLESNKIMSKEERSIVVHHEAGWLVGWLAGWLVGWLAGWLVGWLAGWLVGWLAGWLVGWLVVEAEIEEEDASTQTGPLTPGLA
jgi:hypothetical protein